MHGKSKVNDVPVLKRGLLLMGGAAALSSLGIKQPIHDGVLQGLEKLRFPVRPLPSTTKTCFYQISGVRPQDQGMQRVISFTSS